jgi:hypothetical protein
MFVVVLLEHCLSKDHRGGKLAPLIRGLDQQRKTQQYPDASSMTKR